MSTLAPTALTAAVERTERGLAALAPHLLDAVRAALPRATGVVARRLLGALYREDVEGLRDTARWTGGRVWLSGVDGWQSGSRHGFNRVEFEPPVSGGAGRLLTDLAGLAGGGALALEVADAAVNLALAYARRADADVRLRERAAATGAADCLELATPMPPDDQAVFFERLASEGHNLHPCGRTRLGWDVRDVLAHDLEAPTTEVGFVAVRRDLHVGDDVGRLLAECYTGADPGADGADPGADGADPVPADAAVALAGADPNGYAVQPVHAWQLARVIRHRYADLIDAGALVPLDGYVLPATPTAAVRTVLLGPDLGGVRRYLKLSLDIQVTSTRRTISVASTRNGPAMSVLLHRILADDEAGARILLLAEPAGAAGVAPGGRQRDLAAIVRSGLGGRLGAGEVAVAGSALGATCPVSGRTVLALLVDWYAANRRLAQPSAAALAFLDAYARLLLPPLLRLATGFGIALEAHLQNSIPTFVAGAPHRLGLRDLAGLRVHRPRLAGRGVALPLWPGSVIATDDVDVMRAKLGYTALQAHLGELVVLLGRSHDLDEPAAWGAVRAVVDEAYDGLRSGATIARDRVLAAGAAADHAFLTAPRVPHKALVRMRLAGTGDIYVPVDNPLR